MKVNHSTLSGDEPSPPLLRGGDSLSPQPAPYTCKAAALPQGWRTAAIGEVCLDRTETRDPRNEPETVFRYVDISSVDSQKKVITEARQLPGKEAPSRARQVIRTNDVLVATTRPNLNAVALVPPELDNAVCSTGFCVLRSNGQVEPEFLFAFVQAQSFVRNLSDIVKGALYPAVTDGQVLAQKLLLPPLPEQRRIAARLREQLAEVAKARAAVQAQLEAAIALPAARLRTIFDSLAAREWPSRRLQDAAILQRGRFSPRPRNNPVFYGGRYPFIQTGDVDSPDGFIHTHTQTLNEYGLAVSKLFLKGTLVISIAANIGIVGVLSFDSCMPDSLVGIQGKPHTADNRFLYFVLRHLRSSLQALAPHMAQANLSLALLGPTEIPVPNLETQKQIAAELDAELAIHLEHLDSLRDKFAALDHLPAALLREAFAGRI